MKHHFLLLFLFITMISSGEIVRLDSFPSAFVKARNISIWLPDNYSNATNVGYSVLYTHDGQNLFEPGQSFGGVDWGFDETMTKLMNSKSIRNTIVVGIWNTDLRRQEYFPEEPFYSIAEASRKVTLGNNSGMRPLSDNYLKFIVTELKPYIDKNYRTNPSKNSTFLAGSSMGGLISMYGLLKYPEIFGGAACISTHWPGIMQQNDIMPDAFLAWMEKKLPVEPDFRLYFDHGTETLDSLYAPWQSKADAILRNKKYTSKNWITKVFPGAAHDEKSWKARLEVPLTFLLQP